jgi:D-3-phosphoglycerate dehydrogenase / 2-oxoglutarate reductase
MDKPHILVADWLVPDFELEAKALGSTGITWSLPSWSPPPPPAEEQTQQLLERIRSAERIDGVLFMLAPLTTEVINALPSTCKHLQRVGIGLDTVDIPTASARGITVANTPDYATEEVAVHATAMILSLHRQLDATQKYLLSGGWRITSPAPITRLSTLTLGLIGLGRIGHKLADLMRPMVKEIIFSDPAVPTAPLGMRKVELNDLLQTSDIVSLHCPLLPNTRNLINTASIERMKKSALLINVARGALVDADALAEALQQGKLAGAALDVYEPERLPANSPLRLLSNVILTSHTAWYSIESVVDSRTQAIEKLISGIGVRPLKNLT